VEADVSRSVAVVAAVVVLLLASVHLSPAQPDEVDANAQRIFSSVMSPYCPGKLLADCTSPAAGELRAEIRSRLAAGEPPDAIERELYARFGDSIRAVPAADTLLGRVLRTAPVVVLVLSFGGLAWYLARRPVPPDAPRESTHDAELERRLEDELENS
jgi:cytochrome c-type biogenesis protein CcmH